MVTSIERGAVTLYSRNGKVVGDRYRLVATALGKVKRDAVLDGELVAIDPHGISRFQLLQNALRSDVRLLYCLFDLMFLDGADLRALPLVERKERPRRLVPEDRLLMFSEHRAEHGVNFFKETETQGLEGVMGKRAMSTYRSGERSADWLKIKTARRREAVIVGFTAPRRSRPYFGAPVLAVRDDDDWRYVGHVGTGFSHSALEELDGKLWPLRTNAPPFKIHVKDDAATTWVKPKLVAEVKFAEWTKAGEMRQAAYLGLREDKRAEDVVEEKEVHR
jgi:bifunctional non-homologous end joining protein LigD